MAESTGPNPRSNWSFDEFLDHALYHPEHGFYAAHGRAGRRGDFLTSPEVGPLFGAVLARALDEWWDQLGRPDPFTVVEVGAGPGTLARSILAAEPRCGPRYVAVEVSEPQRALHPDGVSSRSSMPSDPFVGVILANELLDNLPWRMMVGDRELTVGDLRDPALGSVTARHDRAVDWVREAVELLDAGRVVAFDYTTSTSAMAERPWLDWVRTYRGHRRGGHPLDDPGGQDITVEVAVDQLPEPHRHESQAEFLRSHGIDALVAQGRRAWEAGASRGDLTAIKGRSAVREAEALLDPDGLGAFSVLQWIRPRSERE